MIFIDTHTHLFLKEFEDDRHKTVQRALASGVQKMVLPNVDSTTVLPMNKLVAEYPEHFFPLIGLHPTSVKNNFKEELKLVEDEFSTGKYKGVGEIGIDLYWDKTHYKEQVYAFEYQIEMAKNAGLPIVIHSRDSFDEIFEVLARVNDERLYGIFHSFTGSVEQANKAIDMGFYIGIGGIVTFKNSGLEAVVAQIPLGKLVLETDSPYLTPAPNRGKRNESAYILYIAKKIAQLHGVAISEVAAITTKNAETLFKI